MTHRIVDNNDVKTLDPNDWNSIKEYVEFQVAIETELMRKFTTVDLKKLSRDDLSDLPPGFIPMELRIDPTQFSETNHNHTHIDMYVYEGGKVSGKNKVIVDATSSDYRGDKNATANLTRNGLSKTSDEKVASREIIKKFNSSFADLGNITDLKSILESLPKIEIADFEVDGIHIRGFQGAITALTDDDTFLAENGMVAQQASIAREGVFPTFESAAIELGKNGELKAEEMLKERMMLIEALGLPLDKSEEQIREVWGKQLEAGYNQWANETRELLESIGSDIRVPTFREALHAQKAITVIDELTNGFER